MSSEDAFSSLPIPLAEALRGRGFTQLTAVQQAVLDPALAGRDLRISSQTGSGKTLAVGLVLAPLLETGHGLAALLVAPTRELAAQLGRELTWLYAGMNAKVAVVSGGASYRDEHRALADGPRIVVATPGRLIDHLDRGSINPSTVGAVVLDEADQMLDLGFREELDSILSRVPAERATHLVSATFSREVLSLASRYQKNAAQVEGSRLGGANEDITHVVHVVRPNETLSAIINLLLMAPGERALLFVRTRADASELAERLSAEGIFTLPLSGELEQRERNKTLEAFRSGNVSTLVATDVAARGLDIPEVARVIHVDAPTELEGFTHRSGRTGRAGNKGTSIVIVPPAARERVRRLLHAARVQATWAAIPTPAEVREAADERLMLELTASTASPPQEELKVLADRLLAEHAADPATLVAALLARAGHPGSAAPREITPVETAAPRPPRSAFVAFRVNWGEVHGADPRRLLALVCRRGQIRGDQVGSIRIGHSESTFEVMATVARDFAFAARRRDPRDAHVWIELIQPGRGPERTDRYDRRDQGPMRPRAQDRDQRSGPRGATESYDARTARASRREPRGTVARDPRRNGPEEATVVS